jgi:diacylglycerol kinase (ATP)
VTTRTCVIYNPAAGRGKAEKLLKEIAPTLGPGVELRPSARPEHAVELAQQAADERFDRVVAAGGDGTVHEVANGLVRSGNRDVIFSTWPLGSANDYAFTLGLLEHWKRRGERPPTETIQADVGRVTGGGRERFYVNSVGVGFNGMVGLEARKIRWLRGMPLYTWAFLKAMVKHFKTPTMSITFDGEERTVPTLALTVNLAQREGGFPLTPHARVTDGLFDYMHAMNLWRWHLIRFLPGMATGRLPTTHPRLKLGRAAKIEIRSETPLFVHTDGEFFCVPADGLKDVTMEVLPGRLRVEVYPPAMYGKWK